MTVRQIKCILYLVAVMLASQSAASITAKQCALEAKTDLEKIYCDILQKEGSSRLPSFRDFQRNNVETQRLILRGPARKLGIVLPKKSSESRNSGNISPLARPTTKNKQKNKTAEKPGEDEAPTEGENNTSALINCVLRSNQINCPRESYFLVINIPADRLSQRVLSKTNTLAIRQQFANESVLQYLSDVYPYYIEKMLLIGLGDSTVSFTKFNAIYEQSTTQGQDFSKRFAKMYELLKTERQTMAIKTRYRNNFPNDIEQCMRLNDRLIACDNISQNWVYQQLITP